MDKAFMPTTPISIVIAARNEEQNVGKCINAILAQNYPGELFEIVVVDDHSNDNTASVIKRYADGRVRYVSLAEHVDKDEVIIAYKKKAIATGISNSKGTLIVTTDADCTMQPDWLLQIAAMYEAQHPVMIVAPVDFVSDNSIVQTFQSLDFMSMQGITVATHYLRLGNMSNGANLAFTRDAYGSVNGYEGVDHLASGDDYLLMMKLQKAFPGRIAYLKSKQAIVSTLPQPDWQGFYRQRVRWASKSGKYDDKKMTLVLSFVYLFNAVLMALFITAIFNPSYWIWLVSGLVVKVVAELMYLYPVAGFFAKRRQLLVFPLLQPLHIVYIVLVGFAGFVGTYQWKGRTIR